ncbi:MAG: Rpn family recombination-promoting nuclease/putative transposase [Firmicutes bacterium]|nr:Rpn family recombination-promoting nuclease/putative transposase [Bacillota bacterium]
MEYLWVLEPDSKYDVLNNKHDKGYKYILSVKKVFLQLLKSFVRQDWVHRIDKDSLEQINRSFILQDFNGKEADLIYRVKIDGREVFF